MPASPNILLILCDDLAWGDLSCHGNPVVATSRLDRLHEESARLTRYCSGPLCTPARAALMTGRHPFRTRAFDTYLGRSMLDPSEHTLAQMLREQGYATGIFGKWHLGDCYPMRPNDQGFDESLIHLGGGLRQPANRGRDAYFDPDLMRDGQPERSRGYCTDTFTDGAIDFIGRHRDQPFFCYLAPNAVHSPFEVAEEWVEPHRQPDVPERFARLYGMVSNIDHNVGRVLDELDRQGLADDTLVIFSSDHGPCGSASVDGRIRYNAGLRGRKSQMYEGGIRVPCFWRWPAAFPGGMDVDRIANPIDVLPTLASACGADPPRDRVVDGWDLTPLLRGQAGPADWPDRTLCMQWHRGDEPVRGLNATAITQQWKWYRPDPTRTGGNADPELYDLWHDPHERQDVSEHHPGLMDDLRQRYDAWFDDVSATRENNYAPPRIVLGSEHEPVTCLTRQDWRLYDPAAEGWDEHHPGYWLVRVERDGPHRITIDCNPVETDGLRFRCGEAEAAPSLIHGPSMCVTFTAELSAGDHPLEAYLDRQGGRIGVQRVWVARA